MLFADYLQIFSLLLNKCQKFFLTCLKTKSKMQGNVNVARCFQQIVPSEYKRSDSSPYVESDSKKLVSGFQILMPFGI